MVRVMSGIVESENRSPQNRRGVRAREPRSMAQRVLGRSWKCRASPMAWPSNSHCRRRGAVQLRRHLGSIRLGARTRCVHLRFARSS